MLWHLPCVFCLDMNAYWEKYFKLSYDYYYYYY